MTPPDDDAPWNEIPDPLARRAAPEPPPAPGEPSATAHQRARARRLALAGATLWLLAFAWVLGLRRDIAQPVVLAQLVAWTLTMIGGLVVTLRTGADGFPPGVRALGVGMAAVVTLFVGLAGLPAHGHEVRLSFSTVRGCATMALVFATPPALMAALVLRRGFLNAPTLRGALLGAVIGLSGAAGIHSHCSVVTFSHVLVAHGLSLVLCALAGAVAGRRFGRA